METMLANGEESVAQYERGEITKEEAQAHHAKVHDAMVDYASTLEGAEDYRADAADAQALADQTRDPEDEFVAAHLRSLVDEGAQRAQVNREVENAYRASQGQPPLTTPVPQTFAQEAEAQAAAEQAAAEKATKDADPFGLRIAAATADPSKGFAVETTFDAPNPLPQQPPATTGEWTFQPNDVPAAVITPENGHGFGNPDNNYRLSTGLGISPQELQRISDEALETSGYGQALRDAGLLAPRPAAPSGSGRGFSVETTFDVPEGLPQRPPTTAGEWTFDGTAPSISAQVITPQEDAVAKAVSSMGPPIPTGSGFRGRREQRHQTQWFREHGAHKFGAEFVEATQKYRGRYDEKQIMRAATALADHHLSQNPHATTDGANAYAAANLDNALSAASAPATR